MFMRSFRSIASRALAGAAIAFVTTPAQADAPVAAKPAMWKVSDHDTTIYLFGTIHLLPKNLKWRSAALDSALLSSNELVIETIIDEKNPQTLMAALSQMAVSPNLPPLAERVKPEYRANLAKLITKSKMPPQLFDKLETWAAAFLLLGPQFADLGVEGEAGVETVLRNQFTKSNKPIGQLETNAEQLSYFDRLSEKAQREFLEAMVDGKSDLKKEFAGMLASWQAGDVKAIAKTFNDSLDDEPELVDSLLTKRNANWEKWVAKRLATPGTVFVAVGAGHLAGDKSVITMLEKSGLKVQRVQ